MANVVPMSINGVLRSPTTGHAIMQGQLLYWSLIKDFSVILLSDDRNSDFINHWLMMEGMNSHNKLILSNAVLDDLTDGERRVRQVNSIRGQGDIIFVVEADPVVTKELVDNGYNAMTFTHARYALPSWRPDFQSSITPWAELSKTVEHTEMLKKLDKRMEEEPN